LDACASRLRQPDRDRLLRRAGAVLALSNVFDLFVDELAGLRARRLALPPVASGALDGFFLRHIDDLLSIEKRSKMRAGLRFRAETRWPSNESGVC
jgi:hypothetical protein